MRYMEFIAKLDDLGAITEDRKQTIHLSEVSMIGDFLQGEIVKIYICDQEVAEKIDKRIKKEEVYV